MERPVGDIVTLLDLTPRDYQDGELFPLSSQKTWWLPTPDRRIQPYTLSIQQFPFRGPTQWGQRFTFDIASVSCGDLLLNTFLQIELSHWLDDTTIMRLQSGQYNYAPGQTAWFYANSLGTVIVEKAEFEVNNQTIETIDGDCIHVISKLFSDMNSQYGLATDGLGTAPLTSLLTTPASTPYPTLSGTLLVPIPFFFSRVRLQETFPLLAVKEGSVRIHITLRPFDECIRVLSGRRLPVGLSQTLESPLSQTFSLRNGGATTSVKSLTQDPLFKKIQLITYAAHTDGILRQQILRRPFETLTRVVNTFTFSEPLKYLVNKNMNDSIQVQLPLEANHPMEEIIWFVRRKSTANNNEWTNYSAVISPEHDPIYNPFRPLLRSAKIQMNGIDLISADEQWFREHIAMAHSGGSSSFNNYIYGYSFAKTPGEHQPSGTANASRIQSLRLTLDVRPPGGAYEQEWEVKVFVICLEWLRFQDGLANRMFMD